MPKLKTKTSLERRTSRKRRVRGKVSGTAERPRLAIFRSNRGIYAQIIDDVAGRTIVGLTDKKLKAAKSGGKKAEAGLAGKVGSAHRLGLALAEQALGKKVKQVVFDRGGYRYAGRVKALADGARTGGLTF